MENTPLHPTVVIVDDNRALRTILFAILTDEEYPALMFDDGGPALDVMRGSPEPMVVLLDINMPRISGVEVLEAVALDVERLQRHAITLMTAEVIVATAGRVQVLRTQLGIPLLAKPFTAEQLLDAVVEAEQRLPDTGGRSGDVEDVDGNDDGDDSEQ